MQQQKLADLVQQPSELLDPDQAAELLRVKPGTLAIWRCTGRWSLPFLRVGRSVRYRRSDLEAWLSSRVHGRTPNEISL